MLTLQSLTHAPRWRATATLALLCALLAACGGEQAAQPGPTPGAAAPAAGTTAQAGLNPAVAGTVELWHFWGSPLRRNAIRRVIALCNQQLPNITVNDTVKPFGDIWTANIAAVAAGSGMPDVIVEDRPQMPQRAADGIAENLQERVDRDGIRPDDFWPFAWQQTQYEGGTYGIPFETEVRVLYWNKNAFREAGLDPETPPKTWEELWQYADKLDQKNPDGSYERIAFFPLIGVGPDVWGYANDVEWISAEGQPQLNSAQAAETLAWVKRWVDRYGGWQNIQNFRAQFAAPPQDEFMSGRVAMKVDINGYTSQIDFFRPRYRAASGEEAALEWGVSDMPYNTDRASWSGGFALSIPRGAQNQEAAWEFIKCATGPAAQESWARDTYSIPGNQVAARSAVLAADPRWQLFIDAMSYTTGGNFLPSYPNWREQLDRRYEQVWQGQLDPQAALDEAQQAVEQQATQ